MIPTLTNGTSGATQQSNSTQSAAQAVSAAIDPMATEQTFLKLLVTQLQNQDPLNPQDGTQFVAQLAQFSSLEQQMQMRQDLDAINTSLGKQSSATPATSQTSETSQA
ncbi:MAG: hypothetical protein LAP38_25705 [Acidobacteriia bacterium]|nr:hypothetical protein [Terriglobia bacterium]